MSQGQPTDPIYHRGIRSFVRRQGRHTKPETVAQIQENHPAALAADTPLDGTLAQARQRPCILEIGFGMGHSLLEQARMHPELFFIGIEVHKPGLIRVLHQITEMALDNLVIIDGDAMTCLRETIAPGSLQGVQLFFPDPWPKKRHHKRRIVQETFLTLVQQALQPGGYLHIATDHADYASWIAEHLQQHAWWHAAPQPYARPNTKFEQRGQRLGHTIVDFFGRKS